MSSACRSSDGGSGGGLEVLNHVNEDVLFLTPNQDQEEEEYEDKLEAKEAEELFDNNHNAHDLYAGQAQISLMIDAGDINDDLDNKEDLHTNNDDSEIARNDGASPGNDLNDSHVSETDNKDEDKSNDNHNSNENGDLDNSNKRLDFPNGVESHSNIDEGVMSEMKYLFKNTRYFLIKSNNFENIDLAKQKGVWSTPKINEIKLNKAYKECANVLLIFSVSESGRFQGYARLSSECIRDDDLQVNWILPPTLSARSLNGVFKIDWVTKNDLFFTKCAYILNPWNENKPVKVGRDGQEIEPHAGELLCRQFDLNIPTPEGQTDAPIDVTDHLNAIISKSKKRHEDLVNEKDHHKSRSSDHDRDRRYRDRSSDRNGRSDERRQHSSDRNQRDSESSKQRESSSSHTGNGHHQNNSSYHRNENQGHQSFSHKRNYHDGSSRNNYDDRRKFNSNYNNYQNSHNNNFPYQQYANPNMRNMNPYQQQQQQPFYNPMQHSQPMYNGSMPMHQGINPYQPPMQHMQQNYMMYPQQHMPTYQNNYDRNINSSPKKQRMSNDFMPAAKDIILKSQTYEEYLAAASTIQPQSVFDRLGDPADPTQYVNYEALAHNRNSSKYEQEVEEFLRKTAGIGNQSTSQSRYKSDEKSSSSRSHEKKSSSHDKDRDRDSYRRERDSHRRDHRHGSHSSQERSTRRRSRDRK